MLRVVAIHPHEYEAKAPFDTVTLESDERRLRRKVLRLQHGDDVVLDLPQTVTLQHGQLLELEDGRFAQVIAAQEPLYEVRGTDPQHLLRLAWHIGNRHTSAQLEPERILLKRDHVLKTMLEGLGATVASVTEAFFPEHGAYHSHVHPESHALLNRR
jgi:urease accessory protein